MMGRAAGALSRPQAPALRFLLGCLAGWVVLRVLMAGYLVPSSALSEPRAVPKPLRPFAAAVPPMAAGLADDHPAHGFAVSLDRPAMPSTGRSAAVRRTSRDPPHRPLLPSLLPLPPPLSASMDNAEAVPAFAMLLPPYPSSGAEPDGRAVGPMRLASGWSLSAWLYWRGGSRAASGAIAAAGQLGGSQAGLRLARKLDGDGRLRAFGRAVVAVARPRQRELAAGLSYAPIRNWPVDVTIEHRLAVGSEGRTALAAMISGGVDDVALPAGFRLAGYGQAGVVGAQRRDGFADGALVADRPVAGGEAGSLRLGAIVAGAAQPGVSRIDIGPRLTLPLPAIGKGGRIALDWRQRVAGDARPVSGPALTIAGDF